MGRVGADHEVVVPGCGRIDIIRIVVSILRAAEFVTVHNHGYAAGEHLPGKVVPDRLAAHCRIGSESDLVVVPVSAV
ncbi:MAG: hypothetical protein BWY39_01963 [Spirochaetes bacterium ADurb.Bin269]|nr:MAG: hypothetical protein BWY39_01963 [Spirochaetes bacterium ADurb.Bin269]